MHNGLNDTDLPIEPPHSVTANERLQCALAERDRFLERNPHLRPMQMEIDRLLDKSGNHEGRMAVLGTLMQGRLLELQKELGKLSNLLMEAVKVK